MSESERLLRYKSNSGHSETKERADDEDTDLETRIVQLLNNPNIDEDCFVDCYYYDYCEIPDNILDKYKFFRDMYYLFGITKNGDLIGKWVERYDLDCHKPIINGEVKN
ncbi:hypothetical protein UFOVP80_50 [uncultured Caudovirales phage]|uniref:Uncharacterized protein n=1 Tax=uncultured Caudovirales phage TaxID=2100421 RepID=A0A6J5L0E0_9CAUD|nr:hypothetical protein UFOVP80_50 [uncultured Caudovirales phage]